MNRKRIFSVSAFIFLSVFVLSGVCAAQEAVEKKVRAVRVKEKSFPLPSQGRGTEEVRFLRLLSLSSPKTDEVPLLKGS